MRRSVFPSEDQNGSQNGDALANSMVPNALASGQSQQLKWQAHQVDTWHDICDGALQDM